MINRINESNVYKINLEAFLEKQKNIMVKYKDKLTKNTRMEIIDKYFLQTMEEVWEVKEEIDPVSRLHEEIDVLMYLASLYAVITDCEEEIKTETRYYTIVNCNTENNFKIDNITNDLLALRRLMPERKWHKPHKGKLEEINIISANIVMNLIKEMINFIIYEEYQINKQRNTSIPMIENYLGLKEEYLLK